MYPQSKLSTKIRKISKHFYLKFYNFKNLCILHGHVFVMVCQNFSRYSRVANSLVCGLIRLILKNLVETSLVPGCVLEQTHIRLTFPCNMYPFKSHCFI